MAGSCLISITGHMERPKVRRLAEKAGHALNGFGAACEISDIERKKFNSAKAKLIIAVGGDGTLLRAAREQRGNAPIVGIAAGEKSALMRIKPEKMDACLKKIALGKFKIEKRMRLQAIADGKKLPPALNEVMLVNRKSSGIINFCLRANGKKVYCKKADGCIVATPTGSTGHAYSAGGKKLTEKSGKIAVVPSNPLYREAKPVYFPAGTAIALDGFGALQEYEVVLDGQPRFAVGKRLVVRKGRDCFFAKI